MHTGFTSQRRFACIGTICRVWVVAALLFLPTIATVQAAEVIDVEADGAEAAGVVEGAAEAADAIDTGTTAWMLTSTALVLLMIPGLALFYGGLVRTKNVLGTMMHCFAAMAIIGVLWCVCGYAMAFGEDVFHGWLGWDSSLVLLRGIDDKVTNGLPDLVFAMFQGKFAIITPALIAGAFAERVRFRGYCLFIALWGLIVYNPLCHSVWSESGYLFNKGAIDFAGGTVVHISAGVSGLVAALYLGARRGYPKSAMHPNNLVLTLLGAGLLWVGWFGFNAGSAVSSGLKTAQALTMTQVAAAAGALCWLLIEAVRHGKATSLGMASGILAGLVAITPAAGSVTTTGGDRVRPHRFDPLLRRYCGEKSTRVRRLIGCVRDSRRRGHCRRDPVDVLHPRLRGAGEPEQSIVGADRRCCDHSRRRRRHHARADRIDRQDRRDAARQRFGIGRDGSQSPR